ncbi:MAG: hypothetical protein ABID38_01635 [Candidatus Diapherotrites archaeon]
MSRRKGRNALGKMRPKELFNRRQGIIFINNAISAIKEQTSKITAEIIALEKKNQDTERGIKEWQKGNLPLAEKQAANLIIGNFLKLQVIALKGKRITKIREILKSRKVPEEYVLEIIRESLYLDKDLIVQYSRSKRSSNWLLEASEDQYKSVDFSNAADKKLNEVMGDLSKPEKDRFIAYLSKFGVEVKEMKNKTGEDVWQIRTHQLFSKQGS